MKRVTAILFIFILLTNIVSSAVVVKQDAPVEEKKGVFATAIGFLKSPIFLGLLLFTFIFVILAIAGYFLITWLIRYLKEQKDLMLLLKRRRISLAKSQKRFKTHFLKTKSNVPIRLVREKLGGKAEITKPIGYYRGDYSTHEGNLIIAFNMEHRKKLFLLPITDILVIPNKPTIEIHKKNKKGEVETEYIKNVPTAKDIIQFNENEVLIYAESISDVGEFFIPVLKSKDGRVIDLSLPVYHTLREAIMDNYLYDQTSMFATLSKKGLEINPFIRTVQKIQDSGQNSETPQGVGGSK